MKTRQNLVDERDARRRDGISAIALETYIPRTNRVTHVVLDGPDKVTNCRRFMLQCGVAVPEIEGAEGKRRSER